MSTKKIISALALGALLSTGVAFAQSTTTPTSTTPSVTQTTPGAPSTGAGGETTANILLLTATAAIAIAGSAYLARRWVRE